MHERVWLAMGESVEMKVERNKKVVWREFALPKSLMIPVDTSDGEDCSLGQETRRLRERPALPRDSVYWAGRIDSR